MKVKVKHVQQPQQAHRVEVANGGTLGALRSAAAETLAFAEGTDAAEVSFSLNKKVGIKLPRHRAHVGTCSAYMYIAQRCASGSIGVAGHHPMLPLRPAWMCNCSQGHDIVS